MPICKFCAVPFSWGKTDDGKFKPLVPVGEEGDLDRTFQDENGLLRADHNAVCKRGAPVVRVALLAMPIPAEHLMPLPGEVVMDQPKRRGRRAKS